MRKSTRIGLDGRVLSGKLSGVGRYVFELCRQLDGLMPEAEFFLYSPEVMARPADNERWHYRVDTVPVLSRLKAGLWLKLRGGTFARRDQLDLFWAVGHFLPLFLPARTRSVFTVYDLGYLVYPHALKRSLLYAHQLFFARDFLRAFKTVAISEGTSRRLSGYFGRSADAIVKPGASEAWRRRSVSDVESVVRKLGISADFLLAVSTIEPRKNYKTLIEAFVSLKQAGRLPGYQLIIVGGRGWRCESELALIRETAEHGVRWLGFLDDADLQCLYSGARLYVCPSIYEGFGIPALEAIACGATALLSDIPELREAGGEAALYVEMTPGKLAFAINAIIAGELQPPGGAVQMPSWRVEAEKMCGVFHSVLDSE